MPLIRMGSAGGEQFTEAEIIYGKLLAGEKEVVFIDPHITEISILDIYIDEEFYNFAPETVKTEAGKATLTYSDTREQDITVAIKLLGTKEYQIHETLIINELGLNQLVLEEVLLTGQTTVSWTSERINSDSNFSFYADIQHPTLFPSEIVVEGNTLTATYEEQENNVTVGLRIEN